MDISQASRAKSPRCLKFATYASFRGLEAGSSGYLLGDRTRSVKATADAEIKTDKIDATVLAHLLRTNLVPQAWRPCERSRNVRPRTMTKNTSAQVAVPIIPGSMSLTIILRDSTPNGSARSRFSACVLVLQRLQPLCLTSDSSRPQNLAFHS